MEGVQTRKRRISKPESTLSTKVSRTTADRNSSKHDDDESDDLLTQSTMNSQSNTPDIPNTSICGTCKQTIIVSTEVDRLQCCLCDVYFHGSCLEVANVTLLDFLYVVSEIGGWCCTSCRLTKKVASKLPKPSKASIHQDHVNQELQEIKNQLSILTSNLLSVSKNSITTTSGVHTAQISDMDNLLSTSNSIGSVSNIPYAQIVGSQQSGSTEKKIGVNPIPNLSMGVRTAILSAVHTELQNKDKRAFNVVITGMPISNIASDATQFSELCCSEFNVRPTIRSTFRLGTAIEGKIQPLLVTLSTTTEAEDLVSRAKQLRFSRSRQVRDRIYLNKHLTRARSTGCIQFTVSQAVETK